VLSHLSYWDKIYSLTHSHTYIMSRAPSFPCFLFFSLFFSLFVSHPISSSFTLSSYPSYLPLHTLSFSSLPPSSLQFTHTHSLTHSSPSLPNTLSLPSTLTPPPHTHSHTHPLTHILSGVDLVNTHGYPDFMENPQKESYPSKKLIGELYRHVKSRACELQLAHTNNLGENILPESRFLVPGRFSHILQAEKVYELYCTTMSVHMIRLGLKSGKS
jgi:hypothetical protein